MHNTYDKILNTLHEKEGICMSCEKEMNLNNKNNSILPTLLRRDVVLNILQKFLKK